MRVIYEHEHHHATGHSRMQAKRATSEDRPHLGIWNWNDGMAAEEIRHLATELITMSLHSETHFLFRTEFNHLSTPNEPSVLMYRKEDIRPHSARTACIGPASDKSFFTPSLSPRPEAVVARPPRSVIIATATTNERANKRRRREIEVALRSGRHETTSFTALPPSPHRPRGAAARSSNSELRRRAGRQPGGRRQQPNLYLASPPLLLLPLPHSHPNSLF